MVGRKITLGLAKPSYCEKTKGENKERSPRGRKVVSERLPGNLLRQKESS